eukprot:6177877-Pleurochrysis_carterae.AAC.1
MSVLVPMHPLLLLFLLLGQSAAVHEEGAVCNRPIGEQTASCVRCSHQGRWHFTRNNHRHGKVLMLRGGVAAPMRLVAAPMAAYASALSSAPIITKALTSGTIFGLSDICAQGIAPGKDGKRDWTRTTVSALVGLLYFGPAAHAWYAAITAFLPGGGVQNTLIKTALGQGIFGPVFTCIFFAASIMATSGLGGLKTFPAKASEARLAADAARRPRFLAVCRPGQLWLYSDHVDPTVHQCMLFCVDDLFVYSSFPRCSIELVSIHMAPPNYSDSNVTASAFALRRPSSTPLRSSAAIERKANWKGSNTHGLALRWASAAASSTAPVHDEKGILAGSYA